MKEADLEAIKDIANILIAQKYPLLSNHYVGYDVKCITEAIKLWKRAVKKEKER